MYHLLDPLRERNMLFRGWFWLGVFRPMKAIFVVREVFPWQSGSWYFGVDFGRAYFCANSGPFCGRGGILWCRNSLLSPNRFTEGRLLKIEWLVTNVTPVGSRDRAEHTVLVWFWLGVFLVASGDFCGRRAILWWRTPLLSPNNFI